MKVSLLPKVIVDFAQSQKSQHARIDLTPGGTIGHKVPYFEDEMLRALIVGVVLLSAAGAALGWNLIAWGSSRFILDVEFELDGKRYSGNTVWEISSLWVQPIPAGNSSGLKSEVRGDAIDIPLADGRTIFLLRRQTGYFLNPNFGDSLLTCVPGLSAQEKARNLSSFQGTCELRLSPRIVIADKQGNLEDVFYDPEFDGPQRARMLSSRATITSAPISAGIVGRHPWISSLPHYPNGAGNQILFFEDFSRSKP